MSAAEEVQVEVIALLSAVLPAVEHEAVAVIGDPQIAGDAIGEQNHPSCKFRITFPQVGDGRNRFAGDDQDVMRRLRVDVAKGEKLIVLIDDVRLDLLCCDL